MVKLQLGKFYRNNIGEVSCIAVKENNYFGKFTGYFDFGGYCYYVNGMTESKNPTNDYNYVEEVVPAPLTTGTEQFMVLANSIYRSTKNHVVMDFPIYRNGNVITMLRENSLDYQLLLCTEETRIKVLGNPNYIELLKIAEVIRDANR